jgi:hypothetical protein
MKLTQEGLDSKETSNTKTTNAYAVDRNNKRGFQF